jgi:hypothetical protein
MRNVEADLPSIKFLTQQRDGSLGIRCLFYSQMSSQPCKILWVLYMKVRISNRAIVRIWVSHLLLPPHSQKTQFLVLTLPRVITKQTLGLAPFDLTFSSLKYFRGTLCEKMQSRHTTLLNLCIESVG